MMQNTGRISDKFAVTHHLKDVGVFSTEINLSFTIIHPKELYHIYHSAPINNFFGI